MVKRRAVMALAVMAGAAGAQDKLPARSAAVAALGQCRAIADAAQRLSCFDRAAQALDEAIARRDVVVVDRQEIRRTRRTLFGLDLPALAVLGGEDKSEPPFVAIDSPVQRVASAGYGKYDITIEDGATWRNIEQLDEPPRLGDKVHISKTAMGGYFLKSRFARAVRAQRVH